MWITLFFILCTPLMDKYVKSHCIDIHSHIVSQGLHYVPGANPCVLCICDKGSPKWCKSVLCSPPQNCKSFQVGNSCCEFKCLDDILTAHDGYKDSYDVALRLIATVVTAILSLSLLFFLFYRLRRRKILVHQNRQLSEDQRSLNSIGYITGSFGYLPESIGYLGSGNSELEFQYEESSAQYSLWKPHGNYFPRGEAPPPYEEAVRTAQVDNNDIINTQIHATTAASGILSNTQPRQVQSTIETLPLQSYVQTRQEEIVNEPCNSPQYANVTVQNVVINNNNDNSKLEQQKLLQHKQQKAHNSGQQGKSNLKNPYLDKAEKSYDKPVSSNVNPKLNTIKRNRPTTSTYKVQKPESHSSNTYENCNLDKNNSKFVRYENICIDNNTVVDTCGQRTPNPNKPIWDSAQSESTFEDLNVYDARHRTILNLSEYQAHNLPLLKEQRDLNKIKPSRELRNLLFGERSESNIRILAKASDNKEIPLHRTLPKNLRELIARELPNEVHKSDSDNFICRSQTSCCDVPLNSSKSHGNIIETIKHAIEASNENILNKDARSKHALHKTGKDTQIDIQSRNDRESRGESRSDRENRGERREPRLDREHRGESRMDKENRESRIERENRGESRIERENRGESRFDREHRGERTSRLEKKTQLEKEPQVERDSAETVVKANNPDDEQLSIISYQCLSSSQDEDDYRSECENCKSSGFTIAEGEETDILNETMTLQRRPLETGEETSYYRTSLTLPTQTRKPRSIINNTNREAWFTSMQETSSSEESD